MDNSEDRYFDWLSESERKESGAPAPARLKSKIYSALLRKQAESGPLSSVSATRASGRELCVFEQAVEITPLPDVAKAPNFCRICHARVLAERFEHPPIYWSHCPYVRFQNR